MRTDILEEGLVCDDQYGTDVTVPIPMPIFFSSSYNSNRSLDPVSPSYGLLKSGFDRLGAVVLLTVFAVPAAIIAAAIALGSKGSVFYREWRIGRFGRPFKIWKFRTMRSTSPQGLQGLSADHLLQRRLQKDLKDPRVTAVGGFLRRWSLDEIPQLINVVFGEMSLVGPRPVIDEEVTLYGEFRCFYLAAKPGMSGLWQVSGRSDVNFETRVQLDVRYVQSWSFRNDLHILMRTIPIVLRRTGAR